MNLGYILQLKAVFLHGRRHSLRPDENLFYDSVYFTPPYLPEDAPQWSGKKGNEPDEIRKSPEVANEQIKKEPVLKLYPNPAKDYVMVEYGGFMDGSSVEVLDIFGRIIKIEFANSESKRIEVDTRGFSNGVYFIKITSKGTLQDKVRFNILK